MNLRVGMFLVVIALFGFSFASGETVAPPPEAFVGTFSNGVAVEFVGIGMHPSSIAEWWQPDGSPLAERPYADVRAKIFQTGDVSRELCWRWHNIGDKDVQTDWMTEPHYNGAGGHAVDENGKKVEALEASAILMPGGPKTCTLRFSITLPVSHWSTTIESQAGNSGRVAKYDFAIGRIGAGFMIPRSDGTDTLVTVAYQIPNREVRLAAIDKNGQERVAERSQGGSFNDTMLDEYRFADVLPADLVRWQLQTRIRQKETIEFHNVSLEPGLPTKVQVVDVQKTPPAVITGNLQFTTTVQPAAPTQQPRSGDAADPFADSGQLNRRQELLKTLADKHGYKLEHKEPLKYLADAEIKERGELQRAIFSSMNFGTFVGQPGEAQESFEPFMLLFQQDADGNLRLASERRGIITLEQVLEGVLCLKRQEYESPSGLLMTYMPGDWLLSWDPNQPHEWTDAELDAFEIILNQEKDLGVKVEWKTVERPALVVTGKFKAAPKSLELMSEGVAATVEGTFEIPARRSNISASVGTYKKLLQAIGEVLMMPIVDEATVRPTKPDFVWTQTGNPISGHERLAPADEERVLKSLSEQLGYDFTIETREVKLLSIQPAK